MNNIDHIKNLRNKTIIFIIPSYSSIQIRSNVEIFADSENKEEMDIIKRDFDSLVQNDIIFKLDNTQYIKP